MSAFSQIPLVVCNDLSLPTIPERQDCNNYNQLFSQIHSLAFVSPTGSRPTDWTTLNGWGNVIDNTAAWPTRGKYMVGIGSLLPGTPIKASLSGGRFETYRERPYQIKFRVLNMDSTHLDLARRIENGYREFDIWALTVEDVLIGGENGMRAILADASFPFGEGQSRQYIDLTFDLIFYQLPDRVSVTVDWANATGFWGSPTDNTIWGDTGSGEGWGFSN